MTVLQNIPLATDTIKVRWQEPYITAGLNAKAIAATPRGVVAGFSVQPSSGYSVTIATDPVLGLSIANVLETTAGKFAVTLLQSSALFVDLTAQAGSAVYIVLDAQYAVGSASSAQLKVVDALDPDFVVLAKVNVPASPSPGGPITTAHINNGYTTRAGDSVTELAKPRTNLVFNPDFAAGITTGWTFSGFTTAGVSTDLPTHSDTYSLKLTRATAASATATSAPMPVVPGQKYRVGAWRRNDGVSPITSGNGARLRVSWRNAADVQLSVEDVESAFTGAGATFVEAKTELTAPALATHARIEVFFDGCSGVLYVDDVEFSHARAEAISRAAVFGGLSANADLYHTHASAGLAYLGNLGPAPANWVLSAGTAESALDQIGTDLSGSGGATQIGFVATTPFDLPVGAITVKAALDTLDDLKAGINLANTFAGTNTFTRTNTFTPGLVSTSGIVVNGNGTAPAISVSAPGGGVGVLSTSTGAGNAIEGVGGASTAGVFGSNSSALGLGVYGFASHATARAVYANHTGDGTALDAKTTGVGTAIKAFSTAGNAVFAESEGSSATLRVLHGDSGQGLHVTGGGAYLSAVALITNVSADVYPTLQLAAGASKGLLIGTTGAQIGIELGATGAGGAGAKITTVDGRGLDIVAGGASNAIRAENSTSLPTVFVLNDDSGPALSVQGGNAYSSPVALFKSVSTDGNCVKVDVPSGATGIWVLGAGSSGGINVSTATGVACALSTTTAFGLQVVTGSGGGIDVISTSGRGIDVNTGGEGIRVQATGSSQAGQFSSTTGIGIFVESGRSTADSPGNTIRSTGSSHALKVESAGISKRVIEIVGPVLNYGQSANNSICAANLVRAWVRIATLNDPNINVLSGSDPNNPSFSVASVTADASGRITVTFATGTMPNNSYVPIITFTKTADANIHAPYTKHVGQTSSAWTVDVRDANNGGALLNLTTATLGCNILFIGNAQLASIA
jgi:hypothetical protein